MYRGGSGRCGSTPGSDGRGVQRALQATSSEQGADRALRRLRPPDPDRLRLRRPDGRGRGRQGRRRDLVARRHGAALRRDPLEEVTTSMTINATAPILLALYVAVAKKQGADPAKLGGTIQNDILKEYIRARDLHLPAAPVDAAHHGHFAWCADELPSLEYDLDLRLPHPRGRLHGAQELAFTLANGIAYVEAAISGGARRGRVREAALVLLQRAQPLLRGGRQVPRRAPPLGADHEGALRRDGPARDDAAGSTRRPAGATLTAQQPNNNVVRVTLQALAAVLGGTQSLHTNGYDEALALPTEEAAELALRTQQVIAHESGVTDTVDPLAGSFFVERLTADLEAEGEDRRDGRGRRRDRAGVLPGRDRAVGLRGAARRRERGAGHRRGKQVRPGRGRRAGAAALATRSAAAGRAARRPPPAATRAWADALDRIEAAARSDENLLPHVLRAVEQYATVGEISHRLRGVWGEHGG
jgi:methylmalonyl-CoA mutase, N-terminal domain